MNMLHLCVSL